MYRILLVIIIVFQCSLLLAVQPIPEGVPSSPEEYTEEEFVPGEEPPPPEIMEAIETERQMKEEVIQWKKEEEELEKKRLKKEPKKIVTKKPLPIPKTVSKGPSISVIITALVILLISFFIYRAR